MKNDVVKKVVYEKLVEEVNNIDTGGFVLKTKYDTDKTELKNKISDTSGLVKRTAKIIEIEGEIPSTNGLATKAALTAIKSDLENKVPDISSLVRKTDFNTKIIEIKSKLTDHNHDEYFTSSEFHKLIPENFAVRLKQANLVTKTNFDDKLKRLSQKINSNKTDICLLRMN